MDRTSSQSTEYDYADVTCTLPDGTTVNPTVYAVSFAYLAADAADPTPVPTSSTTWTTASWYSGSGAGYTAQIAVGPDGAVTLTPGDYTRWVNIAATPGPVIVPAGTLSVY